MGQGNETVNLLVSGGQGQLWVLGGQGQGHMMPEFDLEA